MSAASSTAGDFPERVGKYELLLPLGTGGTATVYLARTRGVAGFEREVALKLVHAHLRADEESRLHLLEEARLAARIRHPNVVPVTEVDADAIGVFLVMDYVEGEALSGLVRLLKDRGHRLAPRLVARIMNDALAGLHAAHELRDGESQLVGLVHRDFSPQNILVGIEGVARLADFGVAKAASRTVRTKTGLVKGKVAYMSPEQARGHKIDRRCDVWAAGVVVWELVTGRKLYDHEDDVATLLSVVTEEPPRLSAVMQGVPPALDEAVAYALTSDVVNRCPSAETFRCMLEAAWDECGGMASTTELGAFVRQTVGHKLAERRALAARGRSSTSVPAVGSGGNAPALAVVGAPNALLQAPEEGTKTAISAAVPATEQFSASHALRLKRPLATAALLSGSLLGALLLGLLVSSPDEEVRPRAANPEASPGASPPVTAERGAEEARRERSASEGAVEQRPSTGARSDGAEEPGTGTSALVDEKPEAVLDVASAVVRELEGASPAPRVTRRSAAKPRSAKPSPKARAARSAHKSAAAKSSARRPSASPTSKQKPRVTPGGDEDLAPDPYNSNR